VIDALNAIIDWVGENLPSILKILFVVGGIILGASLVKEYTEEKLGLKETPQKEKEHEMEIEHPT
jgi:hypothetical protein